MARKFKDQAAELFISAALENETENEKTKANDPAPEKEKAAEPVLQLPRGYRLAREQRSERLQLLVTPTIKKAIQAHSKHTGASMNDIANEVFDKYIDEWENEE